MTFRKSIFILILLALTSCFKVEERIFLREDGSGKFNFVLNLSQSKWLLQAAKAAAEISEEDPGKKPDNRINSSLLETKEKLDSITGIHNTTITRDDDKFVYVISFDFDNVQSLNTAMNQFIEGDTNEDLVFYRYNNKRFTRSQAVNIRNQVKREMENERSMLHGLDPSLLFKTVSYETIYKFDSKIKHYSNKNAKLSNDAKTLRLEFLPFSSDTLATIENHIKF